MSLTQSYVGTNSIGGSTQAPGTHTAYVKQVTIPAGGLLVAIEGYLLLAGSARIAYRVGWWDDNSGDPGVMRGLFPQPSAISMRLGGTDRWLGAAMSAYFASETDIWIGIHIFEATTNGLAFAGSGSDRTINASGRWTSETGGLDVFVSTTTNDYSIRGSVLT